MSEDCFPSVGTQNANQNFGGSGQEQVGLSPLPSYQENIMTWKVWQEQSMSEDTIYVQEMKCNQVGQETQSFWKLSC